MKPCCPHVTCGDCASAGVQAGPCDLIQAATNPKIFWPYERRLLQLVRFLRTRGGISCLLIPRMPQSLSSLHRVIHQPHSGANAKGDHAQAQKY